jgi:hypothetical protein
MLCDPNQTTGFATKDTINKASVSKIRCGVWGVNFVFLMGYRLSLYEHIYKKANYKFYLKNIYR